MYAKLRRRGGFTLVEMVWTMVAVSFTMGGFFLLWSSIEKQQNISWSERWVDEYANNVLASMNQDLRNAYGYTIYKTGNYHSFDVYKVDYINRNIDTLRVKWSVRPNGDVIRSETRMNGGGGTSNVNLRATRFSRGPLVSSENKETLFCTGFEVKTAGDLARSDPDYVMLDSTALQLHLALRYTKQFPTPTVHIGNENPLPKTYNRLFQWTTMVYMKNFYIRKHAEGLTQF